MGFDGWQEHNDWTGELNLDMDMATPGLPLTRCTDSVNFREGPFCHFFIGIFGLMGLSYFKNNDWQDLNKYLHETDTQMVLFALYSLYQDFQLHSKYRKVCWYIHFQQYNCRLTGVHGYIETEVESDCSGKGFPSMNMNTFKPSPFTWVLPYHYQKQNKEDTLNQTFNGSQFLLENQSWRR